MIATITKDFTISISHQLNGLPEGHQCARLHGHNVIVRVELTGPVNDVGMVLDYGELSVFGKFLEESFDHRHLNEAVSFNPTAENMAAYLYQWCDREMWPVSAVSWSESPKTWATYRGLQ
jgi:6-pyruvoyltetrahydropterin/6-carboxytetrahydropterin synthase